MRWELPSLESEDHPRAEHKTSAPSPLVLTERTVVGEHNNRTLAETLLCPAWESGVTYRCYICLSTTSQTPRVKRPPEPPFSSPSPLKLFLWRLEGIFFLSLFLILTLLASQRRKILISKGLLGLNSLSPNHQKFQLSLAPDRTKRYGHPGNSLGSFQTNIL